MIDSSGHLFRSGLLSGTITDYGDYDQCMSIRGYVDHSLNTSSSSSFSNHHHDFSINARYCLLTIRPPNPPFETVLNFTGTHYENSWPARRFATPFHRFFWRITSGLCFPTACYQSEMEQVFRKGLIIFLFVWLTI